LAEKKSPPVAKAKAAEPSEPKSSIPPGTPSARPHFEEFVQYVLQQKASLGALLEHALPISTATDWAQSDKIRIGFRKNHSFYLLQAQHKANFDQLQTHLRGYTNRGVNLMLEAVADTDATKSPVASMREKEKTAQAQTAADAKSKFLAHEIVQHTKEIFGAELSGFDIDKSKN
jgi:hypothetical protein